MGVSHVALTFQFFTDRIRISETTHQSVSFHLHMAPAETSKNTASKPKQKREKIFHPESRKAGQIARSQLRKSKLTEASSKRHRKFASQGMSGHLLVISVTDTQ
jgi:hypothetical protein